MISFNLIANLEEGKMIILILQMRKLRFRGTKYHIHVTQLGSGGLYIQTQTGLYLKFLFEHSHFSFFLATLHSLWDLSSPTRN